MHECFCAQLLSACRSPPVAATSDRPRTSDLLDSDDRCAPANRAKQTPCRFLTGQGPKTSSKSHWWRRWRNARARAVSTSAYHLPRCRQRWNARGPVLECSVASTPLQEQRSTWLPVFFLLSPPPRRKHRVQTVGQWGTYSGVGLRTVLCVAAIGGHGFQAMRALTLPPFLSASAQRPVYCPFSCST